MSQPKIGEIIDFPEVWIKILDHSIMQIHTKVKDEFEIEHSRKICAERIKISNGKKFSLLHTSEKFVIPSKEVREFVATEERSELVLADAFVINTLPQRMTAKFFIQFNNPVRPTKIFDNVEEAIEWLKQFEE